VEFYLITKPTTPLIFFKAKLDKTISLDKKRLEHILEHPEMKNQLNKIKETLEFPDEIRESLYDKSSWLFYRFYEKTIVTNKYMLVVTKILNKEGFIVTAFYTDKIKKGEVIWKKD